MAQHGHLSREEKKHIRKERRKLRKDLRKKGIKSRKEFEKIAQMLGLVYGDDGPFLLPWLWKLGEFFAGLSALQYLLGLSAIVGLLFAYAVLANQKGNFIINMSGDLMQLGYELSDTEDFNAPKMRCVSDVLEEVNPYSIQDLPDDLDDQEGCHNFDNVVAYTFWIRNNGKQASSFDWYMLLNKSTKNVHRAVWTMLFDEGQMSLYACAMEDGEPETLKGLSTSTLIEEGAAQNDQFHEFEEGYYDITGIPYEEDRIITSKKNIRLAPGEKHKYTVVLWVEGDDLDCTEAILGGHAGYQFRFVQQGSTDDIFEKIDYSFIRELGDSSGQSFLDALKGIFKKEK